MKRKVRITVAELDKETNQEISRDYEVETDDLDLWEIQGSIVDMTKTLLDEDKPNF